MEGGSSDETFGMIPRAIDMIFRVSSQLKDRGWKYQMEGQFLEVYNEVVSRALGCAETVLRLSDQRLARHWSIRYQEARNQKRQRWEGQRDGRGQQ